MPLYTSTHRRIPVRTATIVVRIGTSRGDEISTLWDVFLSLLSNFYLLFFTTTAEIVALEDAFVFFECLIIYEDVVMLNNEGREKPNLSAMLHSSSCVGNDWWLNRMRSTKRKHNTKQRQCLVSSVLQLFKPARQPIPWLKLWISLSALHASQKNETIRNSQSFLRHCEPR